MAAHEVTAIVPTLGRPELRHAVESAMGQTVSMEIVVVVADPNRVPQVESALGDADRDRLRIVHPRTPLNGSAARNLGLRSAGSDLVAFLDDDDWWEPTKTERQLTAVPAESDRFIVSTDSHFGASSGPASLQRARLVPQIRHSPDQRMADYLLARRSVRYGRTFLQTSSLLAPRTLLLQHGWNDALAKHQDWDLLIRLVDGAGAVHVPVAEPLTFVRKGSAASVSRNPDWRASLNWVAELDADPRAVGDFICANVIRPSLLARDRSGVEAGLRALGGRPLPHPSALFGIMEGALRSVVAPMRGPR